MMAITLEEITSVAYDSIRPITKPPELHSYKLTCFIYVLSFASRIEIEKMYYSSSLETISFNYHWVKTSYYILLEVLSPPFTMIHFLV
jgi:hypothetical protein